MLWVFTEREITMKKLMAICFFKRYGGALYVYIYTYIYLYIYVFTVLRYVKLTNNLATILNVTLPFPRFPMKIFSKLFPRISHKMYTQCFFESSVYNWICQVHSILLCVIIIYASTTLIILKIIQVIKLYSIKSIENDA